MFLNSFRISTMDSYSLSVVVYRVCAGFNFLLQKATGRPSCEIHAPNWTLLASVCISNVFLKFGYVSNVSSAMSLLMSSKAFWHCSVQSHFAVDEVREDNGATRCDL
jgi:hypothetical protein